jgi:hypothetical protein
MDIDQQRLPRLHRHLSRVVRREVQRLRLFLLPQLSRLLPALLLPLDLLINTCFWCDRLLISLAVVEHLPVQLSERLTFLNINNFYMAAQHETTSRAHDRTWI